MRTDTPVTVQLSEYSAYPFAIPSVHLTFDLAPTGTRVTARMALERRTPGSTDPLFLNGEGLKLIDLRVDGESVSADRVQVTAEGLTLQGLGDTCRLDITTEISPQTNTALSGLYMSGGRYCTQCEAEGFRRIIFWPDRPDVMSVFTVRINMPDPDGFPYLLSNGNPIDLGELGNGGHWAEWHDPHPKPSYLFALCAGDYDVFSDRFQTVSGRDVALNIFVDKGDGARAAYAMDALKRSMRWDEHVFGREYDLDVFNIVAVRDFNFGAMENKGLNIFNAAYVLADGKTATDADFEAIEAIVAHEYFHNWTGNRITCRDWFQLCLKEGLTVYRDQEFSADMRSRAVQRIKDVSKLRSRQFQEDAGPLAHPVRPDRYARIDNLYTATVYEKGAELIRTLRVLIGTSAFQRGMDLYFERFDGTAATIEDFYSCFEESSGRDLSAFRIWYAQAGTPIVTVDRLFDPTEGSLTLTLSQTTPATPGQPTKQPVPIPLRLALFDAEGRAIPLSDDPTRADELEHTLVLGQSDMTITYPVGPQTATPLLSINRGFSAPVRIVDDLTDAERIALAAVDTDPFAQWDALQSLNTKTLLALANAIRSGEAMEEPTALINAIASAVSRVADTDPAYAALLLRLPDVSELFLQMTPADAQAISLARGLFRSALYRRLAPLVQRILAIPQPETFSAAPEDAASRALRIALIDLLSNAGRSAEPRLYDLFGKATTMTEELAALRGLGALGGRRFDTALDTFRETWSANPLVMDKWYAVQAASPHAGAIDRCRALLADPDFDWTNPNRVRSVAAVLAMGNLVAFHSPGGAGHDLLADVVIKVDPLNPALSARLLTAFEQWKRLDTHGRATAKAALERLAEAKLSGNAADIVSRALA